MEQCRLYSWELVTKSLVWAYRGPVNPRLRKTYGLLGYPGLWYLHHGDVALSWEGGEMQAGRGSWVLVPPSPFDQHFSDDTEISSVRFILNGLSNSCLFALEGPVVLRQVDQVMVRSCAELTRNCGKYYKGRNPLALRMNQADICAHTGIEIAFLTFLRELLRITDLNGIRLQQFDLQDPRLSRCVSYIKNNRLDRSFTEAQLAKVAGVSVGHLNRLFQNTFGQTSRAWYEDYRFNESVRLLESSCLIKEAAYALGFSSPQHFANWFRNFTGKSPSEWRKQHAWMSYSAGTES